MGLEYIGFGGIDWIDVCQVRGHWRALCDSGNKSWVSINRLRNT